jgi:hypothetical protein
LIRTVLLAALLAVAANASAMEMTDLTKCRATTDVTARAECYDRIVDAAVKRGEKSVAQPPSQAFNTKPEPAPAQKSVELAKATRAGSGRLILATTEGEVWAQSEGDGPPKVPAAGAQMTIRKGAMGGFFCALDKYTSFRCTLRKD